MVQSRAPGLRSARRPPGAALVQYTGGGAVRDHDGRTAEGAYTYYTHKSYIIPPTSEKKPTAATYYPPALPTRRPPAADVSQNSSAGHVMMNRPMGLGYWQQCGPYAVIASAYPHACVACLVGRSPTECPPPRGGSLYYCTLYGILGLIGGEQNMYT